VWPLGDGISRQTAYIEITESELSARAFEKLLRDNEADGNWRELK
jgi:hypothetical protein